MARPRGVPLRRPPGPGPSPGGGVDDEDGLVEAIYDAAADPEGLALVIARIKARTRASGAFLFTTSARDGPAPLYDDTLGPEGLDRYRGHYHARDLWLAGALSKGLFVTGAVLPDETMAGRDRFLRSEFGTDFMLPLGVDRMCGLVIRNAPDGQPSVAMSLYRPPGTEAFDAEALAFLHRIVPHLGRAMRIGLRLRDAAAGPGWSLELLERSPWGVFLIAASGRVVFANVEAERILRSGDGLWIANGRFAATGDGGRLRVAIGRALAGAGTDLAVARPSGKRPYLVTVVPLGARARDLVGAAIPAPAVHVLDPARAPSAAADRLAALLGLTPAERRLATGLLEGLALDEIAGRHRLSVETVRSQLKGLLHKTETGRQNELVALLVRCAALVGPER